MIDDEVLGHAFGDGKTMVFFDQSQRKVDAGCEPRDFLPVAVRPATGHGGNCFRSLALSSTRAAL
jgi:hypothetical protein